MEETKQLVGPNKWPGFKEWLQLTYEQLYDFCMSLDDNQLAQPVRMWGDEFFMTVTNIKDSTLIGERKRADENAISYMQLRDYLEHVVIELKEQPVGLLYNHYINDGSPMPVKLYYIEELQVNFVDDGDGGVMPETMLEEGDDIDIIYPVGTFFLNTGA